MKILKSRIEKMIYLTDLEMDLLLSCFSLITLKKGDYILKKEDICDEIIFVNNGLLRFFT